MQPYLIAKLIHKSQWLINLLPNKLYTQLYSSGRRYFMQQFYQQHLPAKFTPPPKWQRSLWGLTFQSPLMNSAGMFKNGEAYDLVMAQGAGGYVGGTSTYNQRPGNIKHGIKLPFITLPKSHISLNFLGLPNLGDQLLAKQVFTHHKLANCPLGWSLMCSPDYSEAEGLENLIRGLWLYHNNPQIDFLEINESCPNIRLGTGNISQRLKYIAENFLIKRERKLPVVVKLSSDLNLELLPQILAILVKYKFDGINLGNTSTNYQFIKKQVVPTEQSVFNYFISQFGGGVGGMALKNKSLALCEAAVNYKNQLNPDYEFHIIRSGGIDNLADLNESEQVGVSLNQWYTGYFINYAQQGNNLYQNIFS
ncbi:MAG: hypothetical protein ACK4M7_03555 [Burkholderiales bacterium]